MNEEKPLSDPAGVVLRVQEAWRLQIGRLTNAEVKLMGVLKVRNQVHDIVFACR
jgi:hypothetical protein